MSDWLDPALRRKYRDGELEAEELRFPTTERRKPRKRGKKDQTRFIDAWNGGASIHVLCVMFDCSEKAIYQRASRLRKEGHKLKMRRRSNRELWKKVSELYREGYNSREIAEKLGTNPTNIRKVKQAIERHDDSE